MTLRLFVDLAGRNRVRALYAFDVLFEGLGIRWRNAANASEADVAYAVNDPGGQAIWLRATAHADWDCADVEVMQFERVYMSPYVVTDLDRLEAVLESPFILVYEKSLTNMKDLLPVLESVA